VFAHQYYVSANNSNQGVIDRYYQVRVYYRTSVKHPEQMLASNILGPTSKSGNPSVITFPSPGTW
jgi:hypothetical protein